MKFQMLVQIEGAAEPHVETYDENTDDPQAWSEKTMARFNDTLRPHEKPRTLLKVTVLDAESVEKHSWIKVSLTTQQIAGRWCDIYKCERCGITGKRFGLGGNVKRDSKFRPKVYLRCDTSLAHLEKKGQA